MILEKVTELKLDLLKQGVGENNAQSIAKKAINRINSYIFFIVKEHVLNLQNKSLNHKIQNLSEAISLRCDNDIPQIEIDYSRIKFRKDSDHFQVWDPKIEEALDKATPEHIKELRDADKTFWQKLSSVFTPESEQSLISNSRDFCHLFNRNLNNHSDPFHHPYQPLKMVIKSNTNLTLIFDGPSNFSEKVYETNLSITKKIGRQVASITEGYLCKSFQK